MLPRQSGLVDRISVCVFSGLCVVAIAVLRDYGISNDEEVQHRYGELILAYYASGFADVSLFSYKNLYLYGGLFDIIAALLAKVLPFDLYLVRHFLSASIGLAGIAATWATARLVAGPRAGLVALVSLAVCGPYFGGMFNHTKDVPFAAAMMGSIYFLLCLARNLPKPERRHLVGFGLMFGAATGLRAMGLLLVGYVFILIVVSAMASPSRSKDPKALARFCGVSLLHLAPALLLGYAIMLLAWPWASLSPLNPLRAIFSFAHFHYEIRTIAAGEIYRMADVPWWYVPLYIVIKTPIIVLLGAALAFGIILAPRWSTASDVCARRKSEVGFLIFVAVFPVFCEAISEGPAFTGMRHFIFVLPVLAVLAGIGFDALLNLLRARRLLQYSFATLLIVAFSHNVGALASLHPYEYLYYNQFVGGLEGAQRRFVMDYWVNIMPEAVRGLQDYLGLPQDASKHVYAVAVCGEKFSFDHYAGPKLQASGGWLESEFFIAPTHMNCDKVMEGRTVLTIKRQGVVIGVVKDRRGISQKAFLPAF